MISVRRNRYDYRRSLWLGMESHNGHTAMVGGAVVRILRVQALPDNKG